MTLEEAKGKGIPILDEPPEGWLKRPSQGTAPDGYHWWVNGSIFRPKGEVEYALVRVKQCGNCKWLRIQEPDYALMCYGGGKYSFEEIDRETAWKLESVCDKWEAEHDSRGDTEQDQDIV